MKIPALKVLRFLWFQVAWVQGLGLLTFKRRVLDSGVQDLGIKGSAFRSKGLGLRVYLEKLRVQGLGFGEVIHFERDTGS